MGLRRIGFSLIEVLAAAAVLTTVLLGMALFQTATVKVNQSERDRTLAVQKSVQMMEEILAYQVTNTGGENGIDSLADSEGAYSFMLTTDKRTPSPASALSGNVAIGNGGYRLVRHIQIDPMPNEKGARRVTVSVYLGNGGTTAAPNGKAPLASVVNIVKADRTRSQPTQVYDMYLVAIENAQGVWADPAVLRELMANTIDYLQANNPGLEIRPHWITRLSYGREPYYKPIVNKAAASNNAGAVPLNSIYFYVGKRDSDSYFFNPDVLGGQMQLDGATKNAVVTGAPYESQANYSFADQYNHAVRYPVEVQKYNAAKAADPKAEMSLRMLHEELAAGNLKNALVVNLHAELIPVPPSRPFSDAARVPSVRNPSDLRPNWGVKGSGLTAAEAAEGARARLVTHPYRMEVGGSNSNTFSEGDTVELRVFPYLAPKPGAANNGLDTEPADEYRKAKLVVRGLQPYLRACNSNTGADNVEIYVLHQGGPGSAQRFKWGWGGWWVADETARRYRFARIWPRDTSNTFTYPSGNTNCVNFPGAAGASVFSSDLSDYYLDGNPVLYGNWGDASKGINPRDLVIQLKNVPFTHPLIADGASKYGVPYEQTLYGFNYFPDPFMRPLDDNQPQDPGVPRNTARFFIRFKVDQGSLPAGPLEVLTTLGEDDDLRKHQAPNRSQTYVWAGQALPHCEQFQIVGDPRLNPDRTAREEKRYNRYFGDFTARAYNTTHHNTPDDYNSFPDTAMGWGAQRNDVDLPRYYEGWRRAMLGSNSLYLNPAGFSFYYFSLGGEHGGVSVSDRPLGGGAGLVGLNELTADGRLPVKADNTWMAKPWMGELFPDDAWAGANGWGATGNLPSSAFRRWNPPAIAAWTTADAEAGGGLDFPRVHVQSSQGSVQLFNGGKAGNSSNWFSHFFEGDTAFLSPDNGVGVANSFKLYLGNDYPSLRPFAIDSTLYQPPYWTSPENTAWRTQLAWGLLSGSSGYYYHETVAGGHQAVAPIVMTRTEGGVRKAAFWVLSSAAPSGSSGTNTLARLSTAASLQAFFDMANPGLNLGDQAVKLLPRAKLTAPLDETQLTASSTPVSWNIAWTRWNDEPYDDLQFTNYAASAFKPTIYYNLKYSSDNGSSWRFVQGGAAQRGVYDASKRLIGTSYAWNTGGLANQEYLLRLEAYRDGTGYEKTHYAYHQISVSVAH